MGESYHEPLSALDAWFLYAERPEAPLHIGGVYIFEGESEVEGGRGALGIAETVAERLHLVPRYRQKVMWTPFNLTHPVWVDDPDFDLSYHVRRAALPKPGDDAALSEYAARVFARQLDLRKPLWELYVIEGDSHRELRRGPGHLVGTALPGEDGNCVIAGHRDTHFRVLKDERGLIERFGEPYVDYTRRVKRWLPGVF